MARNKQQGGRARNATKRTKGVTRRARPKAAPRRQSPSPSPLCEASVTVRERAGRTVDAAKSTWAFGSAARNHTGHTRRKHRPKAAASRNGALTTSAMRRIGQILGAAGHPTRMRMLVKLLDGPATYQALRRTTGQKAGPLYHHVNQLRLAGLILPKQRDLYELTRGGRNLVATAFALMKVANDRRRRPLPPC